MTDLHVDPDGKKWERTIVCWGHDRTHEIEAGPSPNVRLIMETPVPESSEAEQQAAYMEKAFYSERFGKTVPALLRKLDAENRRLRGEGA